jgi:nicotinate phosphoribosyltransferase
LLHDDEESAFRAQVDALGPATTLLVDTYDITAGIATAVKVAGPGLGAIRIDSGDLGVLARQARAQLDELGATGTRIVVSGDLDEFAIAALAARPVDSYGAGTAVVTGSGAPTAGLVYKLVEVDGRAVAKRSEHKASLGGRKYAYRSHKSTGTAIEEVISTRPVGELGEYDRPLQHPLIQGGEIVAGRPTLSQSRDHLRAAMVTLPWDGLKLSRGEAAIPTRIIS